MSAFREHSLRAAVLTPREREVAAHVDAGLTAKQVAAALGIGVWTVRRLWGLAQEKRRAQRVEVPHVR